DAAELRAVRPLLVLDIFALAAVPEAIGAAAVARDWRGRANGSLLECDDKILGLAIASRFECDLVAWLACPDLPYELVVRQSRLVIHQENNVTSLEPGLLGRPARRDLRQLGPGV